MFKKSGVTSAGLSMRLLAWRGKMPSQQYDRVTNDEFDTRIPLHPDEAFEYGIKFNAKYIGSMEVPRPSSRVEIVAAMRRVRYEFKAKGAKKRKVVVDVSTEGVRILSRKKTKAKKQDLLKMSNGEGRAGLVAGAELLHHPIYRIFYVSHDSSDLKIFSYIARDPATNAFKCNVFKSNKKSMAMRIVRTVGQAFEVCHKQQSGSDGAPASSCADEASSLPAPTPVADTEKCGVSESDVSEGCVESCPVEPPPVLSEPAARPQHLELLPPPPRKEGRKSPQRNPASTLPELPECVTKVEVSPEPEVIGEEAETPLSSQHQLQLLRERLEQQAQQTRAAVAQLLLLRDQLAAEQAARCEAQARTHQLLVHNKELLEHIAALVAHLQARERTAHRPISAHQLTLLPQTALSPEFNNGKENIFLQEQRKKTELLVNLINQSDVAQNINNNNVPALATDMLPSIPENGADVLKPLGKINNQQLQDYIITKFQSMGGLGGQVNGQKTERPPVNYNQHYFQNSNAFPNIPPLTSDISNMNNTNTFNNKSNGDRWSYLEAERGAAGSAEQSPSSGSPAATSKESSPEAFSSDDCAAFIMPLSHKGTLTATSEDGRVRLIVPVSPSSSQVDVARGAPASAPAPARLAVPGPSAIMRSTSEKLSSSAKIDRWFSLLPGGGGTPSLSRPESGFVSGVDEGAEATLHEAKALLLQLAAKKKRRLLPLRFIRRKTITNKHTLL